ncbi:glycerol kinase [Thermoplasma volcanium GSS1]|uniref:ATP:glycerol 3-phosphotransferase n=1 Tax=Thermoplasma volcanium (strain ATCC 51530 / DSM 4299 / JCM 9571 / NBRC 15438 / GSS1) TaxID=273116 RepID=Q979J5_THEVO|nr:FGGY family carbohydrate kinase [Thermoplasma volcanium]BAB60308.1 glycerol kinase [Thermoplasma volcanium GSS1]
MARRPIDSDDIFLALDAGTTDVKAGAYDRSMNLIASCKRRIGVYYGQGGVVEQDPHEILEAAKYCLNSILRRIPKRYGEPKAIGITNQRESVLAWEPIDGRPITKLISWKDKRGAQLSLDLKERYGQVIKDKTGLISDPYFSATKIKWLVENIKRSSNHKNYVITTLDSWLVKNLNSSSIKPLTDHSNASRTMLFNIDSLEWDSDLLEIVGISEEILPEVKRTIESDSYGKVKLTYGSTTREVPILSVAGDQQASLFGNGCLYPGQAKASYGTGAFILENTGVRVKSDRLLETLFYTYKGKRTYALEGTILSSGSSIDWLVSLAGLKSVPRSILRAEQIERSHVLSVPALSGLGSPFYSSDIRGYISGLSESTDIYEVIRSFLEAQAFLSTVIIEEMRKHIKLLEPLHIDGGLSKSDLIAEMLANLLDMKIIRERNVDATMKGIAMMSMIGYYGIDERKLTVSAGGKEFNPNDKRDEIAEKFNSWRSFLLSVISKNQG